MSTNRATKKAVLILDDDEDLRTVLGEIFKAHDCSSLGVGSVEELTALGAWALSCDLAVLDVNLGPGRPSGLHAYEWLRAQSFKGRIAFLTGHALSHPVVAKACALGVSVLEKPVPADQLLKLVTDDGP